MLCKVPAQQTPSLLPISKHHLDILKLSLKISPTNLLKQTISIDMKLDQILQNNKPISLSAKCSFSNHHHSQVMASFHILIIVCYFLHEMDLHNQEEKLWISLAGHVRLLL